MLEIRQRAGLTVARDEQFRFQAPQPLECLYPHPYVAVGQDSQQPTAIEDVTGEDGLVGRYAYDQRAKGMRATVVLDRKQDIAAEIQCFTGTIFDQQLRRFGH